MTGAHRTSSWPAGTIVRELPNGTQDIDHTRRVGVVSRPVGRCSGCAEGIERRPPPRATLGRPRPGGYRTTDIGLKKAR